MKKNDDNFRLILFFIAIALLVAGVVLSFQNKTTNIATYSAAFLCLVFSFIGKFEYFEGLGIKAKINQIEENVETIISTTPSDYIETKREKISIEELSKELNLSNLNEPTLDTIIKNLKDKKYSFRTKSGLAKNTGLTIHSIERIIMQLYEKGYVNKAHSKSMGTLWSLSEKGRSIEHIDYI